MKTNKKLIIIAIAAVLLLGGAVAAYFFIFKKDDKESGNSVSKTSLGASSANSSVGSSVAASSELTSNPLYSVALDAYRGVYGNGPDRKKNLTAAGYNYDEVQALVNQIYAQNNGK